MLIIHQPRLRSGARLLVILNLILLGELGIQSAQAQSGAATASANASVGGTPGAAPAVVPPAGAAVVPPAGLVPAPLPGAALAPPAVVPVVPPVAPVSPPTAPTTTPVPALPEANLPLSVGPDDASEDAAGAAAPVSQPIASDLQVVQVPQDRTEYPIRLRRPGFFEVARESIFGPADNPPWTPLPLRTFFTEGWRDPWIATPDGEGGGRRQGWIGATDGNFYRLYWFSYIENFSVSQGGNGYASRYNLYTPLSRRLLLITTIPYLNSNSPSFNLGTSDFGSTGAATHGQRATGQGTSFGDITFTPRLMLRETRNLSLVAQVGIQTPTGSTNSGAGRALLSPGLAFWSDIGAGWVVRGGFNVGVGTNHAGAGVTLISQLAIGRTILPHTVPIFGDFTYYLAANQSNQVVDGKSTVLTLGPGFRTHLGKDYYLLGAITVPVTDFKPFQESMAIWFMKTF